MVRGCCQCRRGQRTFVRQIQHNHRSERRHDPRGDGRNHQPLIRVLQGGRHQPVQGRCKIQVVLQRRCNGRADGYLQRPVCFVHGSGCADLAAGSHDGCCPCAGTGLRFVFQNGFVRVLRPKRDFQLGDALCARDGRCRLYSWSRQSPCPVGQYHARGICADFP